MRCSDEPEYEETKSTAEYQAELAAAYKFIEACIPLALARLEQAGVDHIDQADFWWSEEGLSDYVELIDFRLDGACVAEGLINRRDWLERETRTGAWKGYGGNGDGSA